MQSEDEAATKIQSVFKGHLGRKTFSSLMIDKIVEVGGLGAKATKSVTKV